MITSIRYRGFSFYYKDNDNKYKEIFAKNNIITWNSCSNIYDVTNDYEISIK